MVASRIEARAVVKVMAIVVVAVGVAVLLNHVVVEVKTTIRWTCAAIFLALALNPLVALIERARVRGRNLPRWLAILAAYVLFLAAFIFLVLAVIPPIVREVERLGSQLPGYVTDFEHWANNSDQFRELNDKYDITSLLSSPRPRSCPRSSATPPAPPRRSRSGSSTTSSRPWSFSP